MSAQIINGKAIASSLRDKIRGEISSLDLKPGLAVILVGNNPASEVYVGSKIKACEKVGITSFERRLPEDADQDSVLREIEMLNTDPAVHGILLQLPLPKHLDANTCIQAISPEKDVDGLHPLNIGRLVAGLDGFIPCTPAGSLMLIKSVRDDLSGLNAVVIGRSLLFGKPMGQLLLAENCTVIQAHSRTKNLQDLCSHADILVAAVGRAEMVKADWVKKDAIVIDVGINRQEDGKLKGDVAYDEVSAKAAAITPVPGGVGPMTIACLLNNTLKAARRS